MAPGRREVVWAARGTMAFRVVAWCAVATVAIATLWIVAGPAPTTCSDVPGGRIGTNFEVAAGRGYCLYWETGMSPAPNLRSMHRLIRAASRRAGRLTGTEEGPPIRVILVPSRARIREIVGREANGMTLRDGSILIVFTGEPNRLAIRHEMMHAVTRTRWPRSQASSWILEGLAVLAGGQCSGYTPRGIAAHLQARGELVPLDTLMARFGTLDEIAAHLTAASFAQFVHATAGAAWLEAWWTDGVAGLHRFDGIGTDAEGAWLQYLADTDSRERFPSWERLPQGCGWVDGAVDAA